MDETAGRGRDSDDDRASSSRIRAATAHLERRASPRLHPIVEHDRVGLERLKRQAATASQVSSSERASTLSSDARPMLSALELMKPSASRSPNVTGTAGAGAGTASGAPSISTDPSPTSASAIWDSTWRSPVPSEPSSRTSGTTCELSAATRASSSSGATPAPPAPSWLARTTIAARTSSGVSCRPAPTAWLRSRFHCSRSRSVSSIVWSRSAPTPVVTP